ncbi:ABC transporter substrate-binding protein [Lacisediminihabitans sp.]|jgi:polar amino acid transport system substrate-binding protein|uniref:ABC transporter substrate-binding protein n=1 Tax=Lacisediminihabitans sp. TaxID=2787631 RepID=UPI002F93C55F
MRIRYAIPVLAVVTALALSGCVNNETPTGPSGSSGTTTVTKDAAAAALLPDTIAKAGKLIIGIDPTYAPNEYKDANGKPIGWEVELMDAVGGKLGVKTDYRVAKFDSIIPSITGGKYNLGLSSFTDNTAREKVVDFVNYYTAGIQWASATGKTVDPDNACGLKVAVQATTYEDTDEVPAKSKACTDAGKPAIQAVKFDTQDQATNAVALGQADAMSADSPVTLYAVAQLKGKIQLAGKGFEVAPYGVAVNKGDKLGKALQKAFQSIVDDGTYKKILDKWGVADGSIDTITINAAANG